MEEESLHFTNGTFDYTKVAEFAYQNNRNNCQVPQTPQGLKLPLSTLHSGN